MLTFLAEYSNLLLAIITAVYAFLTWRMVSEMRTARESQSDSNLVISPVPMGPVYAQIELQNAGPGPALDVELEIRLEPSRDTSPSVWRRAAILPSQTEYFLLPSEGVPSIEELAAEHESVELNATWKNIFGNRRQHSSRHELGGLAEGWYNARHLRQPEDVATQMDKLRKTIDKIHREIRSISRSIPS